MNVSPNGLSGRAPDFLLGGVARAGTTSLYHHLNRAPGVFMSPEKEPHFFLFRDEPPFSEDDRGRRPARYITYTVEDYLNLFAGAQPTDMIGEASSWYLYGGERTIRNIRWLYGKDARRVKIIFILRNPVERAWSQFCLKKNRGEESLTFAEAIRPEAVRDRQARRCSPVFDYLGLSLYSRKLTTFLESFDAVKVLLFDDFQKKPAEALTGLYGFLGLEPPAQPPKAMRLNTSGVPRHPAASALSRLMFRPNPLKSAVRVFFPRPVRSRLRQRMGTLLYREAVLGDALRRELTDDFREDVLDLEKITGRDLSAWLEGPSPAAGAPGGSTTGPGAA